MIASLATFVCRRARRCRRRRCCVVVVTARPSLKSIRTKTVRRHWWWWWWCEIKLYYCFVRSVVAWSSLMYKKLPARACSLCALVRALMTFSQQLAQNVRMQLELYKCANNNDDVTNIINPSRHTHTHTQQIISIVAVVILKSLRAWAPTKVQPLFYICPRAVCSPHMSKAWV